MVLDKRKYRIGIFTELCLTRALYASRDDRAAGSVNVEFSVSYVDMLARGYFIIVIVASILLFFVCGPYGKSKSSLQYA
jgi:hypothetical protein